MRILQNHINEVALRDEMKKKLKEKESYHFSKIHIVQ